MSAPRPPPPQRPFTPRLRLSTALPTTKRTHTHTHTHTHTTPGRNSGGQWVVVDGTSCSSPVFAGYIALANSVRLAAGKKVLGFLPPAIYQIAADAAQGAFTDVTKGDNKCTENGCNGGKCTGFTAIAVRLAGVARVLAARMRVTPAPHNSHLHTRFFLLPFRAGLGRGHRVGLARGPQARGGARGAVSARGGQWGTERATVVERMEVAESFVTLRGGLE